VHAYSAQNKILLFQHATMRGGDDIEHVAAYE
jgi:hypothetical protein